jgi:hypothetical protein
MLRDEARLFLRLVSYRYDGITSTPVRVRLLAAYEHVIEPCIDRGTRTKRQCK